MRPSGTVWPQTTITPLRQRCTVTGSVRARGGGPAGRPRYKRRVSAPVSRVGAGARQLARVGSRSISVARSIGKKTGRPPRDLWPRAPGAGERDEAALVDRAIDLDRGAIELEWERRRARREGTVAGELGQIGTGQVRAQALDPRGGDRLHWRAMSALAFGSPRAAMRAQISLRAVFCCVAGGRGVSVAALAASDGSKNCGERLGRTPQLRPGRRTEMSAIRKRSHRMVPVGLVMALALAFTPSAGAQTVDVGGSAAGTGSWTVAGPLGPVVNTLTLAVTGTPQAATGTVSFGSTGFSQGFFDWSGVPSCIAIDETATGFRASIAGDIVGGTAFVVGARSFELTVYDNTPSGQIDQVDVRTSLSPGDFDRTCSFDLAPVHTLTAGDFVVTPVAACPPNDDEDGDGLTNNNESLFSTLLGNADSDRDGIADGNDDANRNGEDDEDEDDDEEDGCPDDDSDGDGEDDEDEDDDD
jgi:hypothetical protein